MLGLVAQRSHRWTTIAIVMGVVAVAISIPFVFTGAHDLITGLLLASMHTVGGLAYLVIGTRAQREALIETQG